MELEVLPDSLPRIKTTRRLIQQRGTFVGDGQVQEQVTALRFSKSGYAECWWRITPQHFQDAFADVTVSLDEPRAVMDSTKAPGRVRAGKDNRSHCQNMQSFHWLFPDDGGRDDDGMAVVQVANGGMAMELYIRPSTPRSTKVEACHNSSSLVDICPASSASSRSYCQRLTADSASMVPSIASQPYTFPPLIKFRRSNARRRAIAVHSTDRFLPMWR